MNTFELIIEERHLKMAEDEVRASDIRSNKYNICKCCVVAQAAIEKFGSNFQRMDYYTMYMSDGNVYTSQTVDIITHKSGTFELLDGYTRRGLINKLPITLTFVKYDPNQTPSNTM